MIRLLLVPVTFLALSFAGCGESVSERSANEARDYKINELDRFAADLREQHAAELRLRSLEERVTALEGK